MYWKKWNATIAFSCICAKPTSFSQDYSFGSLHAKNKMKKKMYLSNGKFTKDLADLPQSDAFQPCQQTCQLCNGKAETEALVPLTQADRQ